MDAVVVADGDLAAGDERIAAAAELLIAADGGAHALDRAGLRPHLLVGDLDSVDPALVERLAQAGTEVMRHPPEKEASDTELAVAEAVARNATSVTLLGALGGPRRDHELSNVLLLAAAARAGTPARIVDGPTQIRAARGPQRVEVEGDPGTLVTLVPVGGDVQGVTTRGLRYALDDEPLLLGSSRGLSNVVTERPTSVWVTAGTLLVIEAQPDGIGNQGGRA